MIRAAFLDRDGVINQKPPEGLYITRWEDFHLLPGAVEGVALLNHAGYQVFVVTNQRCIAKGLLTTDELESMHGQMTALLARSGATIDGIYYCPHETDSSCRCRKPAPGMLLSAAGAHGINMKASWMIGDSEIDMQAGRNAGCKTARIMTGQSTREAEVSQMGSPAADVLAPSLVDAARQITQRDAPLATASDQARRFDRG